MKTKLFAVLLIVLIAGSAMAGPLTWITNIQTDEEYDLGVKRIMPPPAPKIDEELEIISLTKPIPTTPTPVSDFFYFILKGSRWAH